MAQDIAIITELPFNFGKTKQFKVDSEKYRSLLGVIKWSTNDFGYAFFANAGPTLSQAQLAVIYKQVKRLNEDHKP